MVPQARESGHSKFGHTDAGLLNVIQPFLAHLCLTWDPKALDTQRSQKFSLSHWLCVCSLRSVKIKDTDLWDYAKQKSA